MDGIDEAVLLLHQHKLREFESEGNRPSFFFFFLVRHCSWISDICLNVILSIYYFPLGMVVVARGIPYSGTS